jgi:hypothetical protein
MIANALAALEDRNLRLAVLDTLMATKVLPPFDIDEFNRTHAGDEDDDDRDYRYRDEVADALLDIPVTAEQCASVRELVWEAGGNEVVYAIWTFWDGETDEFRIESLRGIDTVLPDLESLSIGDGAVSDLTPLAGCTANTSAFASSTTHVSSRCSNGAASTSRCAEGRPQLTAAKLARGRDQWENSCLGDTCR